MHCVRMRGTNARPKTLCSTRGAGVDLRGIVHSRISKKGDSCRCADLWWVCVFDSLQDLRTILIEANKKECPISSHYMRPRAARLRWHLIKNNNYECAFVTMRADKTSIHVYKAKGLKDVMCVLNECASMHILDSLENSLLAIPSCDWR